MNETTRSGALGAVWFALASLAFLAAAGYAIYAAVTTSNLADARDDAPLWVLGAVGAVSLLGWWLNRRRRAALEAEARRERERLEEELGERTEALREAREQLGSLRQERDELRREREDFERRLREREGAVGRERYLRQRAEEGRRAESEWSKELHAEVMRLYRDRGALGGPGDVPGMVLRLARTMLGAEKGLLLSRGDEDSEGRLELVAHEGFENDPGESAVARRFAGEVLERDRTVREERPGQEDVGRRAPADEEIENLVAIPIYLQDDFGGVVVCANSPEGFDGYDDEVLLSLGDQAGAALQNARLRGELRKAYLATVGVLADAIEVKDPRLRGHSEEVSGYVAAVAERLELPARRREELLFASLLHDVGKIGISDRILLKPAALTPEERAVVRLHPGIGYRLVQQVPALRPISAAVLHHHERFDGEGYPSGLKGQEIPLEARIICVADAFSAMVSDRPYRERVGVEAACAELERCAGTHFDPEVVRIFAEEVRRNPLPSAEAQIPLDPEIEVRLRGGEAVLGLGPIAQVDNLTGLYTRRYFHDAARAEAQRAEVQGKPFGVVLVELTGLADTNGKKGYAAGDEEIRAAAAVVQREAARLGGTAARHGGDRLGVILPALHEEAASGAASELGASIVREATPAVAVASSSWRPGDDGEAVIARARAGLARQRPA